MKTGAIILLSCVLGLVWIVAARDLPNDELEIKGAKIATESEAKHTAFARYTKKMETNVLATESAQSLTIIKLGYEVPGFAEKGERIWQAHIETLENELRGIIWIHPKTEAAHFITGAWESKNNDKD